MHKDALAENQPQWRTKRMLPRVTLAVQICYFVAVLAYSGYVIQKLFAANNDPIIEVSVRPFTMENSPGLLLCSQSERIIITIPGQRQTTTWQRDDNSSVNWQTVSFDGLCFFGERPLEESALDSKAQCKFKPELISNYFFKGDPYPRKCYSIAPGSGVFSSATMAFVTSFISSTNLQKPLSRPNDLDYNIDPLVNGLYDALYFGVYTDSVDEASFNVFSSGSFNSIQLHKESNTYIDRYVGNRNPPKDTKARWIITGSSSVRSHGVSISDDGTRLQPNSVFITTPQFSETVYREKQIYDVPVAIADIGGMATVMFVGIWSIWLGNGYYPDGALFWILSKWGVVHA